MRALKRMWLPMIAAVLITASSYYVLSLTKPPKEIETKSKATSQGSPERLMARAGWLVIENRAEEAKQIYRQLVKRYPNLFLSRLAEARLREEGYDRFFNDPDDTLYEVYVVKSGDSLDRIARQYNITPGLIRAANGLTRDVIRPYMELKILKTKWRVLVDKSTNILVLNSGDRVVKTYPVGTGDKGSTPVGEFKIINRLVNPTWYYKGQVITAESPDNPLGTRWMGFDRDGYGIHGTKDPDSIGKFETLGCIRMLNQHVEELFDILPVGTAVSVIESTVQTKAEVVS
jgi:L,D-transpeptidase ErfK/SrfK